MIRDIDLMNPINWDHRLNQKLIMWIIKVPGWTRGNTAPDLVRRHNGTNTGFSGTQDAKKPARKGGVGSWPFNGSAEIDLGNKTELKLLSTAFTLSCWVYWPSANTNNNVGLMSKYGITNSRAWNLATANTGTFTQGSVTFFYQSVASTLNTAERLNTGSFVIDDDKWHHVVATFIPSTFAAIYVDGVTRASTTTSVPASVADHSAVAYLGRYAANEFAGNMDDFRIYKRALPLGEVQELHELSRGDYDGLINVLDRTESKIFPVTPLVTVGDVKRPLFANDDGDLEVMDTSDSGLIREFTNNTGSTIQAAKVVILESSTGELKLATSAGDDEDATILGIALEDIANGSTGQVQVGGVVSLSTATWQNSTGGSNLVAGTKYYLTTAGNMSTTAPSSGFVAVVGEAGEATTDFVLRPLLPIELAT